MKYFLPLSIVTLIAAAHAGYAQNRNGGDGAAPRSTESRPPASISSFTQNFKKYEGFFNFYYDDKSGKIYLEINDFNKDFLYFRSLVDGIGNGGPERGQASSVITRFTRVGPKIFLEQPISNYRSVNGNADEKKAVENAFAKSILWGFTAAATEGDKVLVDLTPFLVRDASGLGANIGTGRGNLGSAIAAGSRGNTGNAGGGYRLDDTRSVIYIDNTKNFPKNSEFEALLTFTGGSPGGGFGRGGGVAADPTAVTFRMHQAFVQLPDDKFKMRKFDPRSGFNQFSYYDFSAPMTEPILKRFTARHRLEKKNPGAAMSEPVEPIIYYIDRGAPEPIKSALIEGGSWWNQAFEAAGYKNAFIVKELPEGADPMDMRYNVVNWVNRSGSPERAFSYGSSYIDPRTGEILKGVVTLGSDRHRQDYLIAEGLLQPYVDGKPVSKEMERMALARIRQLSAHEIGHTLGLYHNFTSSTHERASVMDYPYPRFNLKADGTIDLSNVYAKGIGTWDKRAIMWGYSDFPKGTDENAALDNIMKETLAQGHIFIPDIGGGVHPLAHQWDDGVNAVDQLNKLMKVRRHILNNFSEKAIRGDAPMATLEEVLVPMYLLHRYQIEAVSNSIGGLYFTHALKNDTETVTKMIEPAEQWRAIDGLLATITPDALVLPEALIQKIPPRPVGYPSTVETFGGHTGVTFDPIGAAETVTGATLNYLLDANRAARLIEYQARDASQPGFSPMVDKLLAETWKKPIEQGYKGQLHILVNNLTLKTLLQLAANQHAGENVRGEALLKIVELATWMGGKPAEWIGGKGGSAQEKAMFYFGLSQIEEFKKNPEKFQPAEPLDMPPGAPIGMPDNELDW